MEFDNYQVVLLRLNPERPEMNEAELDHLQQAHMRHILRQRELGHMHVAGPVADSDSGLRGICIFRDLPAVRIREIAESDPAVQAGRLIPEVLAWMTPKGHLPFVAR